MLAVAHQLESWHDFFLMVGGAAAALAGLVFVAMSLSLDAILEDELSKHRAIAALVGFASAFVIAALALVPGQGRVAVGVEWFLVAASSAAVYEFGHIHTIRRGNHVPIARWAGGFALHVLHVLGAALLALGYILGLYLAAIMMVLLLAYQISATWLLLVAVHNSTRNG